MKTKIFILALIYSLLLSSVLPAGAKKQINPWQKLFTDPVERIYVIMKDGARFKKTNYEERLVRISAGWLEKALKKTLYKIKDIAIIIHNHRFEREFSPSDWRFYKDLKWRGFNGRFLLYCHITKKVYDIEDKK